jgi:hypothetical protein
VISTERKTLNADPDIPPSVSSAAADLIRQVCTAASLTRPIEKMIPIVRRLLAFFASCQSALINSVTLLNNS